MRALLAGGLLLLTTPAVADELTDTEVGALHDGVSPITVMEPMPVHIGWRLDATLASRTDAVDGDTVHEASASVGGEVAVSNDDCDVVAAGGQLEVTTGDGAPVSAQQWGTLCPLSGDMLWRLDHLLQWDVVPTLLARPRLRPEASRVETFSVTLGMHVDMLDDPDVVMTAGETTMQVSVGWVAGHGEQADAAVRANTATISYHREREDDVPLDVDVLAIEMIGTTPADAGTEDPADDAMTMLARLDAVRWSGARWRGLRIGGALGVGLLDVGAAEAAPLRDTQVTAFEPGLRVETDLDDVTLGLALERTHWAVYDGRAVLDDRATLSLVSRAGRIRLRAEGFAALTYLIAADQDISRAATGGLTCVAETDLGSHAVMRVRSDLGRGFYAANATLDSPRLAGEVLATIDLHAGNR